MQDSKRITLPSEDYLPNELPPISLSQHAPKSFRSQNPFLNVAVRALYTSTLNLSRLPDASAVSQFTKVSHALKDPV
ncbi:hypothetical protein NBRC116492_10650 [Aurantivibrio infirmus]